MKTFRFRKQRRAEPFPLPSIPRYSDHNEEVLTGMVGDMTASAPEERMAMALSKANVPYYFRYTVGAPRGLPGWKELDFLASSNGVLYALEVDTAFTHRDKQNADVLHDAIVLNDPQIQAMGILYPQVIHVDGESDLVDKTNAEAFVKRQFGKA